MAPRERGGRGEHAPLRGEEDEEGMEMVDLAEEGKAAGGVPADDGDEGRAFLGREKKPSASFNTARRSFWLALLTSPYDGSPAVRAAWASIPVSIVFLVLICISRPLLPHPEPLKDVHAIGPNWNLSVHLETHPLSLVELELTTPALSHDEEGNHIHFSHDGKPLEESGNYPVALKLVNALPSGGRVPLNCSSTSACSDESNIEPDEKENVIGFKPIDIPDNANIYLDVIALWEDQYYLPINIVVHQYVCVYSLVQIPLPSEKGKREGERGKSLQKDCTFSIIFSWLCSAGLAWPCEGVDRSNCADRGTAFDRVQGDGQGVSCNVWLNCYARLATSP